MTEADAMVTANIRTICAKMRVQAVTENRRFSRAFRVIRVIFGEPAFSPSWKQNLRKLPFRFGYGCGRSFAPMLAGPADGKETVGGTVRRPLGKSQRPQIIWRRYP
jgi:hypothetical protein